MTILGCIDFRLSELSNKELEGASEVLLFSDGRISVGAGNGKLMDAAPKLQVLDICVINAKGDVKRSAIVAGFAGTSALVAMSAITFTSNVLRHLFGEELPTVEQVGVFIAHALRGALEEYSLNQMRAVNAALIVSGFDESTNQTVVQSMKFKLCSKKYEIEVVPSGGYLSMVSGPEKWDLKARLDRGLLKQRKIPSSHFMNNTANDINDAIRCIENEQPFGGQLQLCAVDSRGPRLLPTLTWDFSYRRPDLSPDWNEGDYRRTLLGYDVFDLRVGQCDFLGHESIQLGDAKSTLWAKGDIPGEQRPQDDGAFLSRPRTGVLFLKLS